MWPAHLTPHYDSERQIEVFSSTCNDHPSWLFKDSGRADELLQEANAMSHPPSCNLSVNVSETAGEPEVAQSLRFSGAQRAYHNSRPL